MVVQSPDPAALTRGSGHEAGGGGLRTVTFAGGTARDLEDLNLMNLPAKWSQIRWQGGTLIIPGWNMLMATYNAEFGNQPPQIRPLLLALIITDGEANDTAEFAAALRMVASGGVFVLIAMVGFGEEYERYVAWLPSSLTQTSLSALSRYRGIAAQNANLRVFSLSCETNPQTIADALLRMIE
jgi:hypothetical protein